MPSILNLRRGRRRRMDHDLERELQFHLDRRVQALMESGVSEGAARRQAALEFGAAAAAREEVRETWVWRRLDGLQQDVRYAFRSLTRSWGFALGAGTVLALGIAASTAIYSVVNAVLLQPLGYRDADRIVSVESLRTDTGRAVAAVSGPDFRDWQAQSTIFERLAHISGEDDLAVVVGGRAEFSNTRDVSSDFFHVFGLPPSAGRLIDAGDTPADGSTYNGASVVVSHQWALAHFGSPQAAVGKPFTIYNQDVRIVGVAAPGFRFPGATDIWTPAGRPQETNRNGAFYQVVGKLKAGVPLAAAAAQMRTIGDTLARQHPENRLRTVALAPLREHLTGNVRLTLWVLMGAVLLVFLIACANVANLLLARSTGRGHEIALRAALGAGRSRVLRQLLTESAVLAAIGALVGVAGAYLFVAALVAASPANLPRVQEIGIDWTVLAFALGLSCVATLLFGLVPALHTSRLDLAGALKQGGSKGAVLGSAGRLRAVLVVAEVALSLMLFAGAGLLLRSFQMLQDVDLGFATERIVVAYTQYPVTDQASRQQRLAFHRELFPRIRALPGVKAAAGVGFLPMGREIRPPREYAVDGRPLDAGALPTAEMQVITPGYFETMNIPVREGRDFNDGDRVGQPRLLIVNETLARSAFPNQSAVGQRLRIGPAVRTPDDAPAMEIVGVVADTRWRDPSQPPPAEIFAASFQGVGGSLSIVARTTLEEGELATALRTLLNETAPHVPIRIETMEELFAESLAQPRFRTGLVAAFAAMAALLAAVGIFSVLAYLVGQRTRELAVRRALGAQAGDVVRLVVGEGLRLVAIGLVLGLAGSLAVARVLQGLLFEISPWDAFTYGGATMVLAVVALLATLLPAMRAVSINPLLALRQE